MFTTLKSCHGRIIQCTDRLRHFIKDKLQKQRKLWNIVYSHFIPFQSLTMMVIGAATITLHLYLCSTSLRTLHLYLPSTGFLSNLSGLGLPIFHCPQDWVYMSSNALRTGFTCLPLHSGLGLLVFHYPQDWVYLSSTALRVYISKPHFCSFFDVVLQSLLLSSSHCSFHCLPIHPSFSSPW